MDLRKPKGGRYDIGKFYILFKNTIKHINLHYIDYTDNSLHTISNIIGFDQQPIFLKTFLEMLLRFYDQQVFLYIKLYISINYKGFCKRFMTSWIKIFISL